MIWGATLSYLAYRHTPVEDDLRPGPGGADLNLPSGDLSGCNPATGAAAGEGCAVVLGVLLVVVVAWILIQVVLPLLAFVVYLLIYSMLSQVLNRDHGCKGSVARSLGWGWLWATIYTAPLALAVWLIHVAATAR